MLAGMIWAYRNGDLGQTTLAAQATALPPDGRFEEFFVNEHERARTGTLSRDLILSAT
jgi:hypothetical protein